MAEDEIATKAPETDAQGSLVSGDTPAQEGASMGVRPLVALNTVSLIGLLVSRSLVRMPYAAKLKFGKAATGAPTGVGPNQEISKIADIDVYITKPSDYPHLPSKLLLFLSSGTGIHSKNNQLQADKFASQGFVVVMPDQFAGDSLQKNATDPNTSPDSNPSMIEKVKMGLADTAKSFMIDMWLARQSQEKVIPLLHKVIEGAKDEFADAVANGDGLYAVGYCFGARYVLLLGSELPDTVAKGQAVKDEEQGVVKVAPQIKAGAIAHGPSYPLNLMRIDLYWQAHQLRKRTLKVSKYPYRWPAQVQSHIRNGIDGVGD
ncbi:MAG: hypothetical protein Q9205_005983 [Flavoplaca limonia]